MHGGAIGFASTKGIGSTFSFYVKGRKTAVRSPEGERNPSVDLSLRTQATMLSNQSRKEKEEPPRKSTTPIEGDVDTRDLHVLVVEDNLVNQRVLAKQLRNLGMNVSVANHGGEALDHLRSTKYCIADSSAKPLSLILMDWEMRKYMALYPYDAANLSTPAVMDGLTCVRNIRQMQEEGIVHGHVPVIAVTANVRQEQVRQSLVLTPMTSKD